MKNQGYQKSTFKFINDEEYERRQNRSHKNKNDDRRIIKDSSPEKDHDNSFSDSGNSLKEPQEDLAKFADLEKEKEHSSCP